MEVPQPTAEKPTETPAIHFEPGIHPQADSSENASVYNNFYRDNLDAHRWNKEVSQRIASYAFDTPSLRLTIDGLPLEPPSASPAFTPLEDATNIWIRLPARPAKLNRTGKVYVVKADVDEYELPQAILSNVQEPDTLKQQMGALRCYSLEGKIAMKKYPLQERNRLEKSL